MPLLLFIMAVLCAVQAENGIQQTWIQPHSGGDVPENLLRFGVAMTTELRVTLPDYFTAESAPALAISRSGSSSSSAPRAASTSRWLLR
jgi:hypothetical protein